MSAIVSFQIRAWPGGSEKRMDCPCVRPWRGFWSQSPIAAPGERLVCLLVFFWAPALCCARAQWCCRSCVVPCPHNGRPEISTPSSTRATPGLKRENRLNFIYRIAESSGRSRQGMPARYRKARLCKHPFVLGMHDMPFTTVRWSLDTLPWSSAGHRRRIQSTPIKVAYLMNHLRKP